MEQRFLARDYRLDAIDHRLGSLEQRFESIDRRFGSIDDCIDGVKSEINKQTWRLTTAMLAGMSILTAVFGMFVAFVNR
jgi:hypothetical protein